jgi:hypothetical protein
MSLRLSSFTPLAATSALLFAAACTTPAVIAGTTGGAGGGGGDTAGSTTTGSTATGSTGSDSTATSSTGSGGTSSSTGGGACAGYIDMSEAGGDKLHFASICAGYWGSSETMTAVGYHFAGGAAPGADEIDINGCAGTAAGSAGVTLQTPKVAAPGTFTDGAITYTDGNGVVWSTMADAYQIVITKLDAPGGVIEGTFTGTVSGVGTAKKSLTGAFHVCRVADENAP